MSDLAKLQQAQKSQKSQDFPKEAASLIREKLKEIKINGEVLGENFQPKIGLALGSGLGPLIDQMEVYAEFSYEDLPGFFVGKVAGHSGSLVLGKLENIPVVVMKGRIHFYEGATPEQMRIPIRTLRNLGCEVLLMTNASGSFYEDKGPGSLIILKDFINMSGRNPLMGPNDDQYGPRFISMENALDLALRKVMLTEAQALGIKLHEGVYVGVSGPMYETPAEIEVYKKLGGDLVGMSTVADIIVARHCGMKVICIAAITNFAAGLNPVFLTHEEVLENAKLGAGNLIKLIHSALPKLVG